MTCPLSVQAKEALRCINDGESLFLTGKAGTGKSFLIEHFRNTTDKKPIILAPTGIAALNVKGMTSHCFFGFRPGITPKQVARERENLKSDVYKKIKVIIIDEISMVRADLLECIVRVHRYIPALARTSSGGR